MNVTTRKINKASGAPAIVARSGDTRKTTNYDLSKSSDYNHGAAVAALVKHMDAKDGEQRALRVTRDLALGKIKHTSSEGGGTHKFVL